MSTQFKCRIEDTDMYLYLPALPVIGSKIQVKNEEISTIIDIILICTMYSTIHVHYYKLIVKPFYVIDDWKKDIYILDIDTFFAKHGWIVYPLFGIRLYNSLRNTPRRHKKNDIIIGSITKEMYLKTHGLGIKRWMELESILEKLKKQ